jgi:chromosomal replication initiation ATPase DnaA
VTIQEIQQAVAARFRLTIADFKGTSRAWSIARPRMIAMYLVRRLLGTSYPEIGQRFGGKDHTTAINACRRIKMATESAILTAVAELVAQLGGDQIHEGLISGRAKERRTRNGPKPDPQAVLARILEAVVAHFGIRAELFAVAKPNARVKHVRSVFIFLGREVALASYAQIQAASGTSLGIPCVTDSARRIRWSTSDETRADIEAIRARLG